MSFNDYGGRVYRNGVQLDARCDEDLSLEIIRATPGLSPGWAPAAGDAERGPCFHALIGDGPIFVGLYKQSYMQIFQLDTKLPSIAYLAERIPGCVSEWDPYDVDSQAFLSAEKVARFEIEGHVLEMMWTQEDNFYQYARLTQPDGTVWTAFAGYGVGHGLEDGDHGFDTEERDAALRKLFW